MAKAKEKPGMMMYWETFDTLDRAKDGKLRILLRAMRNYAQYGEEPDFDGDEALELVWPGLAQKIKADDIAYRDMKKQRTDAVNSRWEKERAKRNEYERIQPNTGEYERMRNIPTTSTSTTTATSTSTATESIKAAKASPTRHQYGEYNNVLMSDEELDKLKAEFPTDWQSRIERLSEYIASTGKKYKSHLATIRSWAKKDKESGKGVKPDGEHKSLAEEWGGTVPKCFRTITID